MNCTFERICYDYENSGILPYFYKMNGGESLKKFFKFYIDDNVYLFIDFSDAVEKAEHFAHLTNYYSDPAYNIPKIYIVKNNYIITEYIDGYTLEQFNNNTLKYKLIENIIMECIDWITKIKKTKCDIINFHESFQFYKNLGLEKVINVIKKSKLYVPKDIENAIALVNKLYSISNICMCHNDFMPSNIMLGKTGLKIIDYHDFGYNLEHYDIVSLLYHPKKYFSNADRCYFLDYYLKINKLKSTCDLFETAFVRICRSLDLRLEKIDKHKKNNSEIPLSLLIETRRGLNYLKNIESYVDIHIADNFQKILPGSNIISVVLCAGKGTRMNSNLPKCASKILNKPMIEYIVNLLDSMMLEKNIYVIGYKKEIMEKIIKSCSSAENYVFVNQEKQLGTGHAIIQTIPELDDDKTVILVMGNMPVLTYDILLKVLLHHKEKKSVSTVVSVSPTTKNSSGRVMRDVDGQFLKIVEYRDTIKSEPKDTIKSEPKDKIIETTTGLYIFESTLLKKYSLLIDNNNSQCEYYLTDIINLQKKDGLKIECIMMPDMCEPSGANTVEELKKIENIFSMNM